MFQPIAAWITACWALDANARVDKAQNPLDAATASVQVVKTGDTYQAVPADTTGARSSKDALKGARERIAILQDNQLSTEAADAALASLEAAIQAALKQPTEELSKAKGDAAAAQTQLRAAYAKATGAKPDQYRRQYADAKARYDKAVSALPEPDQQRLVALPATLDTPPWPDFKAAVAALDAKIALVRNRAENARLAVMTKYGDLVRADNELGDRRRSLPMTASPVRALPNRL